VIRVGGRRRGQATIEFAMVFPVIVVLILGLQLTGTGISSDIDVTAAAQAGAQAAASTLDQLDAALSCTAPATKQCVQSGEDIVRRMVDAVLPCAPGNDTTCVNTVHALGAVAQTVSFFCIARRTSGCNTHPARMGALILAVDNCGVGFPPTLDEQDCIQKAEDLAQAAIEDGLGCDADYADCPPPLQQTGRGAASCNHTPAPGDVTSCFADCRARGCTKPVMLEIVSSLAQLGLACAAVRRSLGLDASTATCEQTLGDNPYIDAPGILVGGSSIPYVPYTCILPPPAINFPSHQFLDTICVNETMVEVITVHYKPPNSASTVAATATAVPASQFLTG